LQKTILIMQKKNKDIEIITDAGPAANRAAKKGIKQMLRTVYMIEVFSNDGELIIRDFARNKKTAEKIAKPYFNDESVIRKLQKTELAYINPNDIVGITGEEIKHFFK